MNEANRKDLYERIAKYLADAPANGGHSDDAGANAYELLEQARYALSETLGDHATEHS